MSIILNEYERYLIECELTLTPFPEDAEGAITMDDLINPLLQIKTSDVYLRNHETSSFSIVKSKMIEDRYLMLLIQAANGRASDPAFSKLKTGESRTVHKEIDEGVAVSVHLMIDTQARDKLFPNKYLAILEEIPGLTRGVVAEILTHFTKGLNFSFVRKSNGNSIGCRPIFKLDFYASQTFEESFKNGYLCSITATRSTRLKGMDVNGAEVVEEHKLVIKPKRTTKELALQTLAKASQLFKDKGYSKLKIVRSENSRKTSTDYDIPDNLDNYDNAVQDLSQATFAKKHRVKLAAKISSCQNNFHTDLENKMLSLIKES
ncbi:hypothetical protein [Mannheimia haemolytica]|uniref:hypothetical protein n=1 Tax=Mannheimia haemolytica TaxID=75985 RepID=UPI000588B2DE|nr:hypothetical protein [Mannheimia haemolytica]AJE08362.1 hypothetical protein B824_15670 [Mannheimia haemolytica USDA-ARS-USMARC-184]KYL11584.1 hypothetical protein AC568_01850 [Mannheimia haemolytica]UFK42258.1 hypothetical protein LO774_11180 [Mannheimia haemolytica]UQX61972.1 hypothetical protein M3709_07195 [Mannheimia haemolytica]HDL1114081.1 hypothetical protein [Mannheimia haemolytica]